MRLYAILLCAAALPAQDFLFDAAAERSPRYSVPGLRRWYAPEDLPALFARTLHLDAPLPPGSALEWIFTGDQGGLIVRLEPGRVRLVQRYNDSFAHSRGNPPTSRFPDRVWQESDAVLPPGARSLTVVLDHRLSARILVEDRELLRQTCLLEVRRHQLAWTPAPDDFTAKVSGRVAAPPPRGATVSVNPARRHQTILGFGGILSVPAYARLGAEGKRRWWQLIREYNLLLHREYPNGTRLKPDLSNFGALADASPHSYGDNFPNGEISDFDYLREFRRIGGKVLFEFWDLPPWARREYTDKTGKIWRSAPILDEYVRAMVGYCRIAKERTGAPPEILGIQNEVDQPPEMWHLMIARLRAALDRAGFQSVRLHMPDRPFLEDGIRVAQAIRRSPEAWKAIDWAATHVYDFQKFFEDPDGYDAVIERWNEAIAGKPFLSTELTVNNAAYQSSSYRVAFAMAQLYHKNLALMNASAVIYCWNLLDAEQPSFGATRSLFVRDRSRDSIPVPSSYLLRTYGAFSRRLPEGMVRLEAESGTSDLLATVFEGPRGARTAVLVNRGTAPLRVQVAWPGARFTLAEIASMYAENAPRPVDAEPLLQPGEILTLWAR